MKKSLLELTMGSDFAKVFGKPIAIYDEWKEEEDFKEDPDVVLPDDERTDSEIQEEEAIIEEIHNHEHD